MISVSVRAKIFNSCGAIKNSIFTKTTNFKAHLRKDLNTAQIKGKFAP